MKRVALVSALLWGLGWLAVAVVGAMGKLPASVPKDIIFRHGVMFLLWYIVYRLETLREAPRE